MGALARRIVSEETFQILNTATKSAAISIEAGAAGGILASSGYGSNTAMTFEALAADGSYYPVNGASITLVAGEWVELPSFLMALGKVKFVIGAAAAQDETLYLCLKG